MIKFKTHSKISPFKPVAIFQVVADDTQTNTTVTTTPMWESDARRVAACVEVRKITTSSELGRLKIAVKNEQSGSKITNF